MAASVTVGATLEIESVKPLFQTVLANSNTNFIYAATGDGQRFLLRQPSGTSTATVEQLYVMTNWTSLVAR